MGRLSSFLPALLLLCLSANAEETQKNLDPGKDFASAKEMGMPMGADNIAERQFWARAKKDWQPFGVPMSDDDRANYSTCLDDPGWPECAKIRNNYETKKALADLAKKKDKPGAPPGAKPKKSPKPKNAGANAGDGRNEGSDGGSEGGSEDGEEQEAPGEAPPERAQVSAFKSGASQKAAGRAEKMGADFNSSLTDESAGDLGGAGGGAGKTAAQDGGQAKTESSANAASPKSTGDLLLASASGFKGSFDELGLRMGRGADGKPQVQTKSGATASAAEVAALQERIASEPTALMRRPDFFDVLPREEFQELKEDFQGRGDLKETDFKHIEMSMSQRDFLRSSSCQKMSGDCNRHMTQMSYRKGEDVPPEDLKKIHVAIRPKPRQAADEAEELDEDSGHESASAGDEESAPAASPKSAVKGLYKKLNGLITGVLGIFGGDQTPAAAAVAVGSGPAAAGAGGKKPKPIAFTPRERRKGAAVPARGESDPTDGPVSEKKTRRGGWGWVVAALAGGAVYFKLRRPSDS